ncbi:transposase [Azospira restricta]|uniref:Transposase n=1 Tax=Azospira restricta TaxID=404405 RepID=A0A974Y4D4_9RHOO|nr:transposase [Azospira restricta]
MSSNRYPEEFKIGAVKQITERGYPVAEVAARIGPRSTACMSG